MTFYFKLLLQLVTFNYLQETELIPDFMVSFRKSCQRKNWTSAILFQ